MGRIETPVDHTVRHRGMLAELLRSARSSAGLTYADLQAETGISGATLKRAASGKSTPAENTTEVFLKACGSDRRTIAKAMDLRLKARRDERGGPVRLLASTVSTPAQLADALIAIHQNYGALPYREMQRRAGGKHLIATSSISRILNRLMLPVDERQMIAFLKGCGMPSRLHEEWVNAWARAARPAANSDLTRLTLSPQGSGQHYTSSVLVEELLQRLRGVAESDPRQAAIRRRLTRVGISDPAASTSGQLAEAATWCQLAAVSAG
ncbi:helix-turn-helix domain-containing protein [Streptomyces sp. NPDC001930]|uniref:helix-turn-helix domain-containing protein n=1 Tax=Streptomyces sp. NPDC001930 TaxID=3364625 RepID=UPI0036C1BF6A